jgi:hypothetical protein
MKHWKKQVVFLLVIMFLFSIELTWIYITNMHPIPMLLFLFTWITAGYYDMIFIDDTGPEKQLSLEDFKNGKHC